LISRRANTERKKAEVRIKKYRKRPASARDYCGQAAVRTRK
jgi:hypothetical protein